ncbi:MAG: transcriptional regulator [Acidimicrobiia bacterium]|nr:transcriptional regulator [Acidimicrobiia bacterium]
MGDIHEGEFEPKYTRELGARLRSIREQRGWSLHDVQEASHGRFSGSAVGTYERGERSISVRRLSELATLYGVPVDQFLPSDDAQGGRDRNATERIRSKEKVVIDLVALGERSDSAELDPIRHYLNAIRLQRGDYNGRVLTVRATDVWAMAAMCTTDTAALVESLGEMEVLRPQ